MDVTVSVTVQLPKGKSAAIDWDVWMFCQFGLWQKGTEPMTEKIKKQSLYQHLLTRTLVFLIIPFLVVIALLFLQIAKDGAHNYQEKSDYSGRLWAVSSAGLHGSGSRDRI